MLHGKIVEIRELSILVLLNLCLESLISFRVFCGGESGWWTERAINFQPPNFGDNFA